MSRKRALIVGINDYHRFIGPLRGCVEDATRVTKLFSDLYSFSEENIRTLLNQEATRDAILSSIDWLLQDASKGDVFVLYFSGHGTQLHNEFDPSGKDEVLVAFSLDWDTLIKDRQDVDLLFLPENINMQFIRDKEFKARFDELPTGVNLTLIMDCCHSGDVQKLASYSYPRFLYPPQSVQDAILATQQAYVQQIQSSLPEASLNEPKLNREQFKHLFQKVVQENRFDYVDTDEKSILLAACSPKESAVEKSIDGKYRGLFSYSLEVVLNQGVVETYDELIQAVGEEMRRSIQMPRLACPDGYKHNRLFSPIEIM